MINRKCSRCGDVKPLDKFMKNNTKSSGRGCHCKKCHNVLRGYHYRLNPEKLRIRRQLRYAVKSGTIRKPNNCSRCGGSFNIRQIQGHHKDYAKPYEVTWLCQDCHALVHREANPRVRRPSQFAQRLYGAFKPGICVYELARLIYPPSEFPKAWNYASCGGPHGWVLTLGRMFKKYGFQKSDGKVWRVQR